MEAMESFPLETGGMSSASESVRRTRSLTVVPRRRAAAFSSPAKLGRNAQHGDAARAGDHLAATAARGERDAEAVGQLARRRRRSGSSRGGRPRGRARA